jgi:hypothetical protein
VTRRNVSVTMVNEALTEFFDWQRNHHGQIVGRRLTRSVVARCVERVTGRRPRAAVVSHALQEYRKAQGRLVNDCDYRIAARGYARAALWYVLDGPGLDPLDGEAMTLAHVEWVTHDLAQRAVSDARRELIPAGDKHPAIAAMIQSTTKAVEQVLQQLVDRARAESDFYEQVTARSVQMVPPLTVDEQTLMANLDGSP